MPKLATKRLRLINKRLAFGIRDIWQANKDLYVKRQSRELSIGN